MKRALVEVKGIDKDGLCVMTDRGGFISLTQYGHDYPFLNVDVWEGQVRIYVYLTDEETEEPITYVVGEAEELQ